MIHLYSQEWPNRDGPAIPLFYYFFRKTTCMNEKSCIFAAAKQGTLPERLGTGLQNRGRRFESARYLTSPLSFGGLFLFVTINAVQNKP